jgi:hypothetical protein
MPNRDGTGPKGQGPKDGHGKGKGKGKDKDKNPGQGPMTGGKEGVKEEIKKKKDLRTTIERLCTIVEPKPKRPGLPLLLIFMSYGPSFLVVMGNVRNTPALS